MSHINRYRAEQAARDKADSRLIFWGWICAILVAPAGVVIGGILISRDRLGHGVAMITVACLVIASLIATAG